MEKKIYYDGYLCSRGFIYKNKCILYFHTRDNKLLIIIPFYKFTFYGYIINISDIKGLFYELELGKFLKFIIETDNSIFFEYNIITHKKKTEFRNKNYFHIIGNQCNMINFIISPDTGFLRGEYYSNIINDGLPNWCTWIDFFDYKFRFITQYLVIYIEFGILIWSIYQITQTFPDLLYYVNYQFNFIIDNVKYVITENYFSITFLEYFKFALSPMYNLMNNCYYILLIQPIMFIWQYLKILFQIQIIFKLDLDIRYYYNYYITTIIKIYNLLPNISNKPIMNDINKINMNKNKLIHVKDGIQRIWKFCLKPVKYIIDVIRAPLNGEIGRKIRTKYKENF